MVGFPLDSATVERHSINCNLSHSSLKSYTFSRRNYFENLFKPGVRAKLLNGIPVTLDIKQSSIKIRGKCADVNDAKALLEDFTTGVYKSCVVLSQFQLETVSNSINVFERIRVTKKTQLTCDKIASAVHFSGERPNVKIAKVLFTNMLEDIFPAKFTKVKISKPLIQEVGKATELAEIAIETGCTVSLDRDTNSVLVHSPCADGVSYAVELVESRVTECEKLTCIIRIKSHESWLLPNFLAKVVKYCLKFSQIVAVKYSFGKMN